MATSKKYESRVVVTLDTPMRIKDSTGNDYTVEAVSCQMNLSGEQIYLCPDIHQMREGIARSMDGAQIPMSGDPFSVMINDDPALMAAMSTVQSRVTEIVKSRMPSVVASK